MRPYINLLRAVLSLCHCAASATGYPDIATAAATGSLPEPRPQHHHLCSSSYRKHQTQNHHRTITSIFRILLRCPNCHRHKPHRQPQHHRPASPSRLPYYSGLNNYQHYFIFFLRGGVLIMLAVDLQYNGHQNPILIIKTPILSLPAASLSPSNHTEICSKHHRNIT